MGAGWSRNRVLAVWLADGSGYQRLTFHGKSCAGKKCLRSGILYCGYDCPSVLLENVLLITTNTYLLRECGRLLLYVTKIKLILQT
jgi:hypothetical protein